MRVRTRSGRLRFDERLGLPVGALPGGIADPLAPADSGTELAKMPVTRDSALRIAAALVVLTFLALIGRLVYLQVYLGEAYYQKSTSNFIKERDWPAVRGQIRDRHGKVLVENHPAYSVYVTPQFINADVLGRLRRDLELNEEQFGALKGRIDSRRQGKERSQMMLIAEHISRDQMALLESEKQDLLGVDLVARAHRLYPHETLAAHLLGYLNQVGPDDLRHGYKPGEYVGRSGIERLLEPALRGMPGYEKIVVDAYGRKKNDRELGELARLAGGCTFLTALGDDALGRRARAELTALGLRISPSWRGEAQRRQPRRWERLQPPGWPGESGVSSPSSAHRFGS